MADALTDACREVIASKRSTLWGQHFEVVSPDGLAEATLWLRQAVSEVLDRARESHATRRDVERCGAWDDCPQPKGHNMGRADVPSNHGAVGRRNTDALEVSVQEQMVRAARRLDEANEEEAAFRRMSQREPDYAASRRHEPHGRARRYDVV